MSLSVNAIRRADEVINSFVHLLDREEVRKSPRLEFIGSPDDSDTLRNVRLAVKDNIDIAGLATTYASAALKLATADRSASVVSELLRAGARLIGKTNLSELGIGSTGESSVFGPSTRPGYSHLLCGGSSSGGAAAVAAGFAQVALTTDSGGSTRIPASLCGLVAFLPDFGTISTDGILPLAPSFDSVGWITLSVRLSEAVFNALHTCTARHLDRGVAASRHALRSVRVGIVLPEKGFGLPKLIVRAVKSAAQALGSSGASVQLVGTEQIRRLYHLHQQILRREFASTYSELADHGAISSSVRDVIRSGQNIPLEVHFRNLRELWEVRRLGVPGWSDFDYLLMPTVAVTRVPRFGGDPLPPGGLSEFTAAANVLGTAALVVPFSSSAMPDCVGVQLMATSRGQGADLFRLGIVLESFFNSFAST